MGLHSKLTQTSTLDELPGLLVAHATQRRIYRFALHLADMLALALAITIAYLLRFQWGIAIRTEVEPSSAEYTKLALAMIPGWILLFHMVGMYSFRNLLGGISEYTKAINACTAGMMLVIVFGFLMRDTFYVARAWLLMAWVLSCLLVCLFRVGLRRLAYALRQRGFFVTPAVIIGANQEARALAENLHDKVASGFKLLGFLDPGHGKDGYEKVTSIQGLPIFGSLAALPEVLGDYNIGEVIIAPSALTGEQLIAISEQLAQRPEVGMRLSSGLYEVFTTNMHVQTHGTVPLMTINRLRLSPFELLLKTMLDYSLILLALPLLCPLFLIIAALVKLDSPGPIFHRRRVMGVGGRQFDAFKFRTMFINGEEILAQHPDLKTELSATHKLKWDPRITRIGKFLRRTSLDELPQLINVLRGEMSLVGPRMISPAEQLMYGRMKHNLLTVKPGLTGLWQVSGRSDLSYEDRVGLDMLYIRNYSIWLDVQILFFQTLPAVLRGSGAY